MEYNKSQDISGFCSLYRQLLNEGLRPDVFTFTTRMTSCGFLEASEAVKEAHACHLELTKSPAFRRVDLVYFSAYVAVLDKVGAYADVARTFRKFLQAGMQPKEAPSMCARMAREAVRCRYAELAFEIVQVCFLSLTVGEIK
jgi:hypothetical protein